MIPRKQWLIAGVLLVVNLGGAYLLDAAGLVEGLLSPNGATLAFLLPLALLFYGARLLLLFVVPGMLLGSAVLWAMDRQAKRAQ
ncbi:MAG: hypothetical protein R3B70_01800 [Polyangiaceae bacterium]